MKTELIKQPKSSYKIKVQHTPQEMVAVKEQVIQKIANKTKLPGFRAGKAPLKMVEEQIDKNYFHREVINQLMTTHIPQAINEHKLNPVTAPHVNITAFEPFNNLQYEVEIAERPTVTVGDYKKQLQKDSIDLQNENSTDILLTTLLKVVSVEIPDLMIMDEAERMLHRFVENLTQVGLTLENYLKTKQKTVEQLREEYKEAAEKTLKGELALAEIIKQEEISVSPEEIEEALQANPDEKSREDLGKPENRWYVESILARQKAIVKLLSYLPPEEKKDG